VADEKEFTFTVASQLLRELGERLVGRAAVALGELVKNAYDADAYHVEITLEPKNARRKFPGRIEIRDSGHGMTKEEFKAYWMRIGDDRKARERFSPYLGRPFSGSKGIGRIAAQFLSHRLRIETVSAKEPDRKLAAWLDWREAIEKGDLQEVGVRYTEEATGPLDFSGTKVILEELKQDWDHDDVKDLAQDIWTLEPPYRKREQSGEISWAEISPLPPEGAYRSSRKKLAGHGYRRPEDFSIVFHSPYEDVTREFEKLRRQVMNLWEAKISGRIRKGNPTVSVEYYGEEPLTYNFPDLRGKGDARVDDASFEILVYDPKGRQRGGIPVQTVRGYLREHGGVQIFDHGFRLPYYGEIQNDWLRITYDHSRRLSLSPLLPERLQVPEGMYYMPTYHQVFGFVEIQSGDKKNLVISITRDRLEEGTAFERLRDVIRASLHWYGNLRTQRLREDITERPVKARRAISDVGEALQAYKSRMPPEAYKALERTVRRTADAVRIAEGNASKQLAALSGYATAGVAAIAYHHEIVHQLAEIEDLANELETTGEAPDPDQIRSLKQRILGWTGRVRQLRNMFAPYLGEQNVKEARRYRAKPVVDEVLNQMATPLERVSVDPAVQDDLRLPQATYVEWVSVLQNVLFNALNALQNSKRPRIRIYSEAEGDARRVIVEDSGIGIDLSRQKELFKPFVRGIQIDPTLGELGYGGSGLGLTIVKMIADRRDCKVGFRKPSKEYATAFVLEWEEE